MSTVGLGQVVLKIHLMGDPDPNVGFNNVGRIHTVGLFYVNVVIIVIYFDRFVIYSQVTF